MQLKKLLKARGILKKASDFGCIVVAHGCLLFTQNEIIFEQESWNDNDITKGLDLTTSKFWLVTDNGFIKRIDRAEELEEYL